MQGLAEAGLVHGTATIGAFSNNVALVTHGSDKGLMAEFFTVDEYKPFKSAQEGRTIYEPVEMVRIFAPMAKTDVIQRVKHVSDVDGPSHPERFPAQYRAFKLQQEQVPTGTPLEMCKFIPSHRVKELKAQGIHTAEQMADIPDNILQTLGMGAQRERELCRTFIGSDDEKTKQVSRALAENAQLRSDLEAMREQMAAFNRQMAEQLAARGAISQTALAEVTIKPEALPGQVFEEAPIPEKRGPGRPRKDATHGN